MSVNSLPKTVTRQRRGCDLNPGPTALESSMLTTWLPSHPSGVRVMINLTRSMVQSGADLPGGGAECRQNVMVNKISRSGSSDAKLLQQATPMRRCDVIAQQLPMNCLHIRGEH